MSDWKLLQSPNPNLATLRVHQVDPPGSIYGLKACKVVLWGRLPMVPTKVVYSKKSAHRTVNMEARGVNTAHSQDLARKTGRDITLNDPETKGHPLVNTFY